MANPTFNPGVAGSNPAWLTSPFVAVSSGLCIASSFMVFRIILRNLPILYPVFPAVLVPEVIVVESGLWCSAILEKLPTGFEIGTAGY